MKWLISAAVVVAALIAGVWALGAAAHERVVRDWLDARIAEGWLANTDDVSVAGFPARFDTRIASLDLADPDTGWVWSAPTLDFTQGLFRPDRITATWPATQTLASPFERLDITAGAMTSALDVQPTANFALDASDTALIDIAVRSTAGWTMAIPEGRLTVTRQPEAAAIYDIVFLADGFVPPEPITRRLDPTGVLPDRIAELSTRATVSFERPWDLDAIEERRPQPTRLMLEDLTASWGTVMLRAAGMLDIDAAGLPSGEMTVRAQNWREMVAMAANAGVLPPRMRGTAEALLGVVGGMSGRPEDIDATLSFSNGRVFLGPLPLGDAPRLRLR